MPTFYMHIRANQEKKAFLRLSSGKYVKYVCTVYNDDMTTCNNDQSSVPDPNLDLPDPLISRPPGSGSFYQRARIVRKTLIPTVL